MATAPKRTRPLEVIGAWLRCRPGGGILPGPARVAALGARPSFLQRRNITIGQLDQAKDGRERVVILGSGWAGYTVAHRLDPRKFQAVVVSPRSYFVFTPLLASTAVGTLEFRTALEPVRRKRSQVEFFQGWGDQVDFDGKRLTIEEAVDDPRQGLALTGDDHEGEGLDERREKRERASRKGKLFDMRYDKLIIAVGCYSQTFGRPGVKEHALFLKDVGDARRIRNRILACFETAALPTTSEEMKRHLLNFAVVGGGPTGIEFSAELHDLVKEDLAKVYPDLVQYCSIAVYDVAPKVLPMFDEKLGKYAMQTLARETVAIKTSHHVQGLRRGLPNTGESHDKVKDERTCWTLTVKEEGDIGVGMVVWSTGLMMNPFVEKALSKVHDLPTEAVQYGNIDERKARELEWVVKQDPKTGSILTDNHLRVVLEPTAKGEDCPRAVMRDVFAIGDCAVVEGTQFPATAQVASQKAEWLGKSLNKGDVHSRPFKWNNMGVMAYIGSYSAIVQGGGGGSISGRTAWLIWRGAYLTKTVSLRNKLLIPVIWALNWVFGRDLTRF